MQGNGSYSGYINILQYFLYGFAGLAFLFPPNSGLKDLLGPGFFYLWNGLLVLGGIFGITGSMLHKRRIELIGVPGVVVGLTVYAVFLLSQLGESNLPGVLVGFATICAGSAVGGLGRGIDILHTTQTVERIGEQIRSDEDSRGEEGLGE